MGKRCHKCGFRYGIAAEHCPQCEAENSAYAAVMLSRRPDLDMLKVIGLLDESVSWKGRVISQLDGSPR